MEATLQSCVRHVQRQHQDFLHTPLVQKGQQTVPVNYQRSLDITSCKRLKYLLLQWPPICLSVALPELQAVVDIATLTGACIIALGGEVGGMFTPSDDMAASLAAASNRAGEKVWRMPMEASYAEQLKSSVADMKNTGWCRNRCCLRVGNQVPVHQQTSRITTYKVLLCAHARYGRLCCIRHVMPAYAVY